MKRFLIIPLLFFTLSVSAGEARIYFIDASREYNTSTGESYNWIPMNCIFYWNGDGTCELQTPEGTIRMTILSIEDSQINRKVEIIPFWVVDQTREVLKASFYYYKNGETYISFQRGGGDKFVFRVTKIV